MSLIPTLTTDNLILRGPAAQDAEAFVEFFGSDRAIYVGGPKPPRQSWLLFAAEIGHWAIRGYGMWTVTTKEDDHALGLIGMYNPKDWPEQELGWILYPEAESCVRIRLRISNRSRPFTHCAATGSLQSR